MQSKKAVSRKLCAIYLAKKIAAEKEYYKNCIVLHATSATIMAADTISDTFDVYYIHDKLQLHKDQINQQTFYIILFITHHSKFIVPNLWYI